MPDPLGPASPPTAGRDADGRASAAEGAERKRRPHWTVKTDYPLRVGAFLNMFVAVALHGLDQGYGTLAYLAIALHLLVYPHLAFWLALRASDTRRAELNNLSVDSLLFGVLTGALHFPLWITATVYLASTLNLVINHGGSGWLRSQAAFGAGALLSVALWGWRFEPETAWPATLVCLIGSAGYMAAIGMASHRRTLRLREIRLALSQRTEELSQALARLQQTQAELLEAEKLASLGSLVAGVAHELNTPIGNALVTASALDQQSRSMVEEVESGTVRRSALRQFLARSSQMSDLIVRSCQSAARLIVSFKQVALDQHTEQLRAFDLRQVVDDHLVTLAASRKSGGVVIHNHIPSAIECLSYPGALGQIVLSLVQNALMHAFEPGQDGVILLRAEVTQGRVSLRISDNGCGMQPEVLKHAFDPFFTTRLGQGQNGLGLTICRNMAAGMLGGSLQAQAQPGQGSVFQLEFPLQAPHGASPTRPPSRPASGAH